MPSSNVARGNRYKKKTKDWFVKQGYQCEYTEKVQGIFTPKGIIYKKSDLWGSDGLAMKDDQLIFWNSKVTIQKNKGVADMTKKGCDVFEQFNFPGFVTRQLIIWEPRKKDPLVINCI